MARGNRQGPDEMGPMTGRGLGYCNGYDSPGFTKGAPRGGGGFGFGRGYGHGNGRGYGRGFGRGFGNYGRGYENAGFMQNPNYGVPQYSKKDEEKFLESEIKALKEQVTVTEERLSELKKKDD
ncbi:MAG: DUF5320 domain-containing protein [Candidatus Marinimicrobia bacterium]|nr:DUF5320 domain-containing protein [Candidatus Neomarinimicrobiota bacterium]